MQPEVVISATGMFIPPQKITTAELVASYNAYVRRFNDTHRSDIDAGQKAPLQESSEAFIVKASGIENRYVMDKAGILDIDRMHPEFAARSDDEPSMQSEMAAAAVSSALETAARTPEDVDAVIVSCSSLQRPYPAIAIEVQTALGIEGFAFDMNVACSAATYAIKIAADMIAAGSARCVVTVNPEINTGHCNFRDRDSHFIFGDIATATVIERADTCRAPAPFQIRGARLTSRFSSNVRNNFSFINRWNTEALENRDTLFYQNGRRVFKEVVPLATQLITGHLAQLGIPIADVRRLWLHQANINMNHLVATRVLGHEPSNGDAPLVLSEFGNTASAGAIIAFHRHRDDLKPGDTGVICSFGAGYSAGSIVVQKMPAP
ncbi:MAG: beta-ketoacyl-ACP synthase III [Pseudomonadota bacterium]